MGTVRLSVVCKFTIVFATVVISNVFGAPTRETINLDAPERLALLRNQMQLRNIDAYIITDGDAHQSISFVGVRDQRRQWLSGYVGSTGDAVVTLTQAALWTDSRYWLQAEQELSDDWTLMKSGLSTTPTIENWIIETLSSNDSVGADPALITYLQWSLWNTTLAARGINLVAIEENLVDNIWTDQPDFPTDPVFILPDSFAGQTRQEKIAIMRGEMLSRNTDLYIVTALEEIAWLTNLRGSDIPYLPLFRSYMLITNETSRLYLPSNKQTSGIVSVLTEASISVHDYDDIWTDLPAAASAANAILVPAAYSYALGVSYKIYNTMPSNKIQLLPSPVLLRKDRKNDVEAAGMKHAHVKDAVALIQFMGLIEREMAEDVYWDELKAVETLSKLRTKQAYNRGDSFSYISAFGPNSALPHYMPTSETNLQILKNSTFMLDSGGQYYDGTTDVTRTIHYGIPTEQQIASYTALLVGCIDLASLVFPAGVSLRTSDILIRAPLYKLGKNYGHGSTHGIGAFLGVHEAFNVTYDLNFFGSQEPGYYRDNEWGMRLENIVTVVKANTMYEADGEYFAFDTVTLVPYERNLIDVSKLTNAQLEWLNNYHERVRSTIGDELLRQEDQETYEWLIEKTALIVRSGAVSIVSVFALIAISLSFTILAAL
ncbi:xaa-Pro aminopeptidase 2 [Cephus cinctus]|uniref:Xaa-Pro aminopeptidase 2 n=1 Tax=Cephus cinctus TaxID=211228 RepID=A0AAJ7BYH3_CEPCN|nr:xaa-Pro aminopeptidase 2 [Cephus cinctus]